MGMAASVIAIFWSLTALVAVIILFVTLFLIPFFLFLRHLLHASCLLRLGNNLFTPDSVYFSFARGSYDNKFMAEDEVLGSRESMFRYEEEKNLVYGN